MSGSVPRPVSRLLAVLGLVIAAGCLGAAAGARASGAPGPADLPPPQASGSEIRDKADEIVARPEFRPPPRTIPERILRFIAEQLGKVLETLLGGGRSALAGWIIGVSALAALGVFAVRFGRGVRRDPSVREQEMADPRRPPADWRAEAEAHEARGEWKAALRCRYRALVAELAAAGVVEEVPGRTAGEYRLDVRTAAPEAAEEFAAATELFEVAWYGDRPTAEEENGRFRALAATVVRKACP